MSIERSIRSTGLIMRRFAVVIALVVFAFGPAADPLICSAELLGFQSATPSHQGEAASTISAELRPGGDPHSAPTPHGSCVHGHCHHGGAAMAGAQLALAERILQTSTPAPVFDSSTAPTSAQVRQERPPRA